MVLADLPAPRFGTYPVYTVIAEKLHAIVLLGMTNSRMKDYLDLSVLLAREQLDAAVLAKALQATFERRGTALPAEVPVGLTDEFAADTTRRALWQAYVRKNGLDFEPLGAMVQRLRVALMPVLAQARQRSSLA